MFGMKESKSKVTWRPEPAINHISNLCLYEVVKIWGSNMGSMDLVHILMDLVHGGGPWTRGPIVWYSPLDTDPTGQGGQDHRKLRILL